jgi:hypothetical protein
MSGKYAHTAGQPRHGGRPSEDAQELRKKNDPSSLVQEGGHDELKKLKNLGEKKK